MLFIYFFSIFLFISSDIALSPSIHLFSSWFKIIHALCVVICAHSILINIHSPWVTYNHITPLFASYEQLFFLPYRFIGYYICILLYSHSSLFSLIYIISLHHKWQTWKCRLLGTGFSKIVDRRSTLKNRFPNNRHFYTTHVDFNCHRK